jgi:hypothetical protein
MIRKIAVTLCAITLVAQAQKPPNIALVNGKWFNGKSFDARTVYSVNGRFTFSKPGHLDRTLDLAGT